MAQTAAERQAAAHRRRQEQGLQRLQLWVPQDRVAEVKKLVEDHLAGRTRPAAPPPRAPATRPAGTQHGGRRPSFGPEVVAQAHALLAQGLSQAEVARRMTAAGTPVSKGWVQKYAPKH